MKPGPVQKNTRTGNGGKGFQPIIGAHFSIAKGLHEALYTALAHDCTAAQLFTKNATTWKERKLKEKEIALFEQAGLETGITAIAAHASYLINIASPDKKKHAMSARALKEEIVRCSQLQIPFCILHPGAHMGKGLDDGIRKISQTINEVFEQTLESHTRLLLETTAGQGSGIGHTFEQLARIIERVTLQDRVGVCLDTCHIFAAGYDIRSKAGCQQTLDLFISLLGLDKLHVVHFNDSKKDFNSRVDRHEHIGKGFIGTAAFEYLLNNPRLAHIPKILETPKGEGREDWDRRNLETLRSLCRIEQA